MVNTSRHWISAGHQLGRSWIGNCNQITIGFVHLTRVDWSIGYMVMCNYWIGPFEIRTRDSLLSRDPLRYLKTILYSSILSKIWTYLSLSSLKKLNLCEIWHPLLEIKSHFLLKINASAEQVFDKSSCCLIMEKCLRSINWLVNAMHQVYFPVHFRSYLYYFLIQY